MRRRGLTALGALLFLAAGCSSGAHRQSQPGHLARIAFAKGQRIGVADREGRHWHFLVRGDVPLISPDGHWVAFLGAKGLEVIEAGGGPVRSLVRDADEAAWSPDSRHLAALGIGPAPRYDEELSTVDRATGTRRLIAVAQRFLGYDFSPDGKRLAFAMAGTPDDNHSDVYVSATGGGALRRLTWDDRSSWPVWAPDGSISFARRDGPLRDVYRFWGRHRIWRMAPDGTHRRVLTARLKPPLLDARMGLKPVAWSRDGRTLLAVSPAESGDRVTSSTAPAPSEASATAATSATGARSRSRETAASSSSGSRSTARTRSGRASSSRRPAAAGCA